MYKQFAVYSYESCIKMIYFITGKSCEILKRKINSKTILYFKIFKILASLIEL